MNQDEFLKARAKKIAEEIIAKPNHLGMANITLAISDMDTLATAYIALIGEINDAPVVAHMHGDAHWWVSDKPNHYHTHKARLVRIEKIKE